MYHTDLFHILPVFLDLPLMGKRSGLHLYLYDSIYLLSPNTKA